MRLELALLLAPCLLLLDLLLHACQLSLQVLPGVRVLHALQVQPVFSDSTTFSLNAHRFQQQLQPQLQSSDASEGKIDSVLSNQGPAATKTRKSAWHNEVQKGAP